MSRNKRVGLSSNQTIREAIQKIALHGMVHKGGNGLNGGEKIVGYVAKIHIDPEDELCGTVDVQEYVQLAITETEESRVGYHEGVFLSAIQDNSKGMVIIPKKYSDVVVTKDSESGDEFVTMFSHVDLIQLDSHDKISIGVKEREPYDEKDVDSPEVKDLKETGVMTNTTYKKDSILTVVKAGPKKEQDPDKPQTAQAEGEGGEEGEKKLNEVKQLIDSTQISQTVGKDKTSSLMNLEKVEVKHVKSSLLLNEKEATLATEKHKVKVVNDAVYLGSDTDTDFAVLGKELAAVLSEMLGYLGQVVTPTSIGPQPPANVAKFIALKAKIEGFKNNVNGFLTKHVKIQMK